MNFTVQDWIEAVEKEQGKQPSDDIIQFITAVDNIGRRYEAEGRNDAITGSEAYSDKYFYQIAFAVFPEPEVAKSFAELMQLYYMTGYKTT